MPQFEERPSAAPPIDAHAAATPPFAALPIDAPSSATPPSVAPSKETPSSAASPRPPAAAAEPPAPWHRSWPIKGLFFIVLILFLKVAQAVFTPVMVAVVLTFLFAPGVRALRRHGVPEVVGAGILVVALLTSGGLLASALVQPASQWWERAPSMVAQLMSKIERVRAMLPLGYRAGDVPRPRAAAPPETDTLGDRLASEGVVLTGALLGQTVSFALSATSTVILLYFLLASEHWMLSRTIEAVPRRRTRALLLSGVRSAQRDIGRFLGALAVIYGVVGALMVVALAFIGLPNPVLWGTIVAVGNFVPYLGPIVLTLLLLMAGIVTFNTEVMMVAPAAAFVLIHAVEANLVSPFFVGRRLTLSPLAVFVSVMFWGWLWGLAGAVFAVPLLVGVRGVCKRYRGGRLLCIYLEGDRRNPPSLRSLLRAPRPREAGAAAPAAGQRKDAGPRVR